MESVRQWNHGIKSNTDNGNSIDLIHAAGITTMIHTEMRRKHSVVGDGVFFSSAVGFM
ncbi:hypothetical protein [Bacillus cereus]